jgi:hypothetical protein
MASSAWHDWQRWSTHLSETNSQQPGGKMRVRISIVAAAVLLAAGCATKSSSNVTTTSPVAAWEGPVFVTQQALPAGVDHQVIGSVSADATAGYDSVTTLYPALAAEAKKIGANAVVSAKGARKVTALSWSAPYATGIAVRVKDPQKLKGLEGSSY